MGCTARARPALTPAQPQQALPRARDEEHGRREERIQQRARVRFLAFVFPGFSFLDGPTCPCDCLDLALCRFTPLPRSFSLAVAHSPVQRARCCFVPHLFGGPWGGHRVWGVRTRTRTQNEPKPSQGEVPGGRKTTLEAQLGILNHPLRC